MVLAHRIVKPKHIGSRAEPSSRVPEPGHRPRQQRRHDIGVEPAGELASAHDVVIHLTRRAEATRGLPAISGRSAARAAAGSPCRAKGPGGAARPALAAAPYQREELPLDPRKEIVVTGQEKAQALERAARLLGRDDQASRLALGSLWDEAFENGRLAALDEFQDRFCVCMK